jgi:hypothetical protein
MKDLLLRKKIYFRYETIWNDAGYAFYIGIRKGKKLVRKIAISRHNSRKIVAPFLLYSSLKMVNTVLWLFFARIVAVPHLLCTYSSFAGTTPNRTS